MKTGPIVLVVLAVIIAGLFTVDRMYIATLEPQFLELEKQRIVTSNKLATAKIVSENLNHVRDLVFKNMDFPGQKDTVSHESIFFEFLTSCLNDLKLTLISVKPVRPQTKDRITTYGYDIEIEGDFFAFGELCAKFENSRRIIALESFDVSLIEEGRRRTAKSSGIRGGITANKRIRVKMRVNTYRIKKAIEPPVIMTPKQRAAARKTGARLP
ncbi:MAG: type 4a pilus biogenesis protein PilO [Chitinispirillaceae bacterium]|nr:type 4a pilus biogenesis protein PilO [Chitinispirillaceae bacterium]